MISFALAVLIGAFIGWTFPQPEWAKKIQNLIVNFFKSTPPE